MTTPLITDEGLRQVDTDEGPGMFLSAGFWLGGALSLAAWSAIWYGVRAFFDYLYTIN